jgi:hypothetical protein
MVRAVLFAHVLVLSSAMKLDDVAGSIALVLFWWGFFGVP